jgi:hypothetical protein
MSELTAAEWRALMNKLLNWALNNLELEVGTRYRGYMTREEQAIEIIERRQAEE